MQFVYDVKTLPLNKGTSHYVGIKQNRSNEDRLAIAKSGDCYYYATFDGHGGGNNNGEQLDDMHVVLYLKDYLHYHIFQHLKDIEFNDDKAIRLAITNAFREVDKHLYKNHATNGSVAAVLIITPVNAITVILGDSRILFVNDSKQHLPGLNAKNDSVNFSKSDEIVALTDPYVTFFSEPHIASLEKKRIMEAQGSVISGRVNGIYIPSRAFGDFDCKLINKKYNPEAPMSCIPDVEIHSKDFAFAIVGSDGLFDGYENKIDLLVETIASTNRLSEVPKKLLAYAMERNSNDDTTCILVTS